jgi:hypothetical protein
MMTVDTLLPRVATLGFRTDLETADTAKAHANENTPPDLETTITVVDLPIDAELLIGVLWYEVFNPATPLHPPSKIPNSTFTHANTPTHAILSIPGSVFPYFMPISHLLWLLFSMLTRLCCVPSYVYAAYPSQLVECYHSFSKLS